MMKWVFNSYYIKFSYDDFIEIVFNQKQNFAGKEGDKFLILDKNEKHWFFSAKYEITYVESSLIDNRYEVFIKAKLIEIFKEEKYLADYIYSLEKVWNFKNPIRHFRRKYVRLSNDDFETIIFDKIDFGRSVLGTILNALPIEHKQNLLAFLAYFEPELLTNDVDIQSALNRVQQYLKLSIIHPARCLVEAGIIWKKILPDSEFKTISFAYPENGIDKIVGVSFDLERQMEMISENIDILEFSNDSFSNSYMKKKKYRGSGLPIIFK